MKELLHQRVQDVVVCLVRPASVDSERSFWRDCDEVRVFPYDMLDGGVSLKEVLAGFKKTDDVCVFHSASVFGPTGDHHKTAKHNVQGTVSLVNQLSTNCRLVLTSSMAAVRGPGQSPLNREYFTIKDWNTVSTPNSEKWGLSYQWSKLEAERQALALCEQNRIPLTVMNPSFILGPALGKSKSFSLTLVEEWIRGKSPVQSRLYADVRDVAKAHVAAGWTHASIKSRRIIVSSERRTPCEDIATWLRLACTNTSSANPTNPHDIFVDSEFTGGAIPIGQKEVDARDTLANELGVQLRPVQDTILDTAKSLVGA